MTCDKVRNVANLSSTALTEEMNSTSLLNWTVSPINRIC